jgi:hypothetical protein
MPQYGTPLPEFLAERSRILDALARPENKHLVMRLVGALAFRTRCPEFGYLQDRLGRVFTDIDFAAYSRQKADIMRFLTDLGYEADVWVNRLFGDQRLVYHDIANGRHIDVFLDRMKFSHVLPLEGRLEADRLTLPLAELLLQKMQIVRLNEKDLIDTFMLLREHPVGESDDDHINVRIVAELCARDWGWWRTVTMNLNKVQEYLGNYAQLEEADRKVIGERVEQIRAAIDETPKSLAWKARSVIGERVKWYEEVEELANRT